MRRPAPKVGLVIPYAYAWRGEPEAGRDSDAAVVVAATPLDGGRTLLAATPITQAEPVAGQRSVQIPAAVIAHLKIDSPRSWIICGEFNEFVWPSMALAETPDGRNVYGMAPQRLTTSVRREMLAARSEGPLKAVRRSE